MSDSIDHTFENDEHEIERPGRTGHGRRGEDSSQRKWLDKLILVGVMAALAYVGTAAREAIAKTQSHDTAIAVQQAQINEMRTKLDHMDDKLDRILEKK